MRCQTQAKKCHFRDAIETEERLVEQLIMGVRHVKVQDKLLGQDEAHALDVATDIARTYQATLADMH